MKRLAVAVAVAASLALAGGAAQAEDAPRQVLTHEKLWMMKRVGAPVASPDGRWVVYGLTEPAYQADQAVSDLWIVPADGSAPPHRLTSSKAAENDPVWSPDSRRLAFSSKREGDEQPQIYLLDAVAGGEARRATASATGAMRPQWRPDGQAILYEAMAYPGARDEAANKAAAAARKARPYALRVYDHYPVRYWNEWLDDRHPTIMVQPLAEGLAGRLAGGQPARDMLSATALAATPGFSGGNVGEGGMSLSPIWSPDGSEIVFTATTERTNAAFAPVGFHLYRLSAKGGEPRLATPAAGEFAEAAFTPDGRSLLFSYAPKSEAVYDLSRLTRVAWPAGGAATTLTPGFDGLVGGFAATADSRSVYLIVPQDGRGNLYRVGMAGGTPVRVVAPKVGGYTALAIPTKWRSPALIAQYGSSVNPAEIVRVDPARGVHRNLTDVDTAAAAAIDWRPPEHFRFTSALGRDIHNMVVLPPAFDPAKKYPLLVFIHGGAASYNPDQIGLRWNYHLLASAGYVVLMTDYTGSTSFGETFARAIRHDPLKTPGDEIMQAVDEALRRYPFIDSTRMCASGASYGGHLTYWLEGATTRFRCMIAHAGEVDLTTQWGESDSNYGRELTNGGPPWDVTNPVWREQSPITYAARWRTPMLLSVGERDFRVPLGNTLEAWAALQRQRVPGRLLVWPEAWHWITRPEDSRQFYREVQAWLAQYLKDAPAAGAGPVGSH